MPRSNPGSIVFLLIKAFITYNNDLILSWIAAARWNARLAMTAKGGRTGESRHRNDGKVPAYFFWHTALLFIVLCFYLTYCSFIYRTAFLFVILREG